VTNIRTVIAFLGLTILLGCSTAEVEKYIYKQGVSDPEVSTEETYWKEVIYKKGSYKFFPRFYTLSRSYTDPYSVLIIYSESNKEIYLNKITIESAKGTYTDQIEFEKTISLDDFNDERNSNFVALRLFNSKSIDLTKYWAEGDIKVTLDYIDNSGSKKEIVFEFELWKGREIVWPT
jgi:hypothetical protein